MSERCWFRSRYASTFPFNDNEETSTGQRIQIYPCVCPPNSDLTMMMNAVSLHIRDAITDADAIGDQA